MVSFRDFRVGFDLSGQPTSLVGQHSNPETQQLDDGSTKTYQYDDLNRLTFVRYGDNTTQTYTFDDMGNRLSLNSTTYGYNAANQLKTINSSAYADYDPNGNMTSGGGRENTWDSQNRLYQCQIGSDVTRFTYGPDGLRRSMTVHYGAGNEATTHYLLEGQNVAQEGHLNAGSFVPDVTYGMGFRGIEYREDSGVLKWYIYDGLGSVVAEVDDGASQDGDAVVTRNPDTDVYGNVSGTPAKHGFVGGLGHTTDSTTALIYMRARYYDPAIGRFVSEDPESDGTNWYAYCGSNPVNAADPSGCVYGFDDELNAQAEMGSAAVKAGNGGFQSLMRSLSRHFTKELKGLFGDALEDLGMNKAGTCWRWKVDGRQFRLDWSGHGGYGTHWNLDFIAEGQPGHMIDLLDAVQLVERLIKG